VKSNLRKLVITGGAGFIGSNFTRYFLEHNPDYEVVNLDKLTYAGNLENTRDFENHPRYRFVKGDIGDKALVEEVLKGATALINFAAETHVDRSLHNAEIFITTDILGLYCLLETARKHHLEKFVQISTDEVYGDILYGSAKESDPLRPSNPYSASKAGADLMALAYARTYKTPLIIIRSSNNFGPFQYPEKLIPLFITNALEGKKLPLYGDGKNIRDWLYVKDNCAAINKIFLLGKMGEIYNVGGGSEVQNIEVAKLILALLNKNDDLIEYVADRPGHDQRYSLDSAKVKTELNWQPQCDFKTALEETVRWYQENDGWWRSIKENQPAFGDFYRKNYDFPKSSRKTKTDD
jgi:dTDP-glucose 4,6-dehydratase